MYWLAEAQSPEDQYQYTHKERTEQHTRLPRMESTSLNQHLPQLITPPLMSTETYRT